MRRLEQRSPDHQQDPDDVRITWFGPVPVGRAICLIVPGIVGHSDVFSRGITLRQALGKDPKPPTKVDGDLQVTMRIVHQHCLLDRSEHGRKLYWCNYEVESVNVVPGTKFERKER